ncbi:calcium-activated chloride channel regulator 1-like [Tiliqua scincoides]|uniref:calcium-activated chloride channel regulator 1-like n=1 Tax=Tiliqua scincoides TaxID=71010 RepID=UPI003461A654
MELNRWLLFLVLQLLHGVTGTMVKLKNGGFEDIVVAINPNLPEDQKLVDNIKEMIQDASVYLFNATKHRFYFKTVKIIVPEKWTSKPEYKRVTIESYEKADVIVADPFLKYGDDPYTLQYGGCGEKGRYIHFTSNFLTNDSFHVVYGSRGRIFVHEWAHLRWGVFDEYNYDASFYINGENKVEATRCSAEITGKYVFREKTGTIRTCKIDHQTGLYETGCQFVPERKQSAPASIMYMQSLPSVTQFCDKSSHNIQATNMQNKLCNYRSTWEVIMDSADFASSSPIAAPPPVPTIFLLQPQERVVCLVLDVSGSMNSDNRINRLREAADLFLLQIIEIDSWVGIVTFESSAKIATGLQHIVNYRVRKSLTNYLPTTAGGGTSICSGVRAGFQVFLTKYNSTEGCEIVLLTDGEDSSIGSCFAEVERSGSKIHTIALGPSAAKELETLADMTGGLKFAATDRLDSNGLMDIFSKISSESGNISQQSIQLEGKSQSIGSYKSLDGVVSIDKSVGNDTFFVVTWSLSTSPPTIILTDPRGKLYFQSDFVIDNTNMRLARLKINETAEVGDWTYKIQNTYTATQVISMTVTTRARSLTEPPVTVKTYMNRDNNNYPNPMVIYAEVSQGFLPVLEANVIATVEQESRPPEDITLEDDGLGADTLKHDGIYSGYFLSFKVNGRYNLKVRVQGEQKTVRRVRRQNRALYVPGYVEEDGVINMNPTRPEPSEDELQANPGNFSRVASGGSFLVADVPSGTPPDVFPPSKITDLEVVPIDDAEAFHLSWTAPGNDYDVGTAERYEIKMSKNPLELRNATFQSAISVNTSGLTPAPAGTKQSFQFKPENFTKENDTMIYFAIRAIDNSNNVGEVSYIATAVLRKSPLPTTLPLSTTATRQSDLEATFTTVSHNETSLTPRPSAHSNLKTTFSTVSHNESNSGEINSMGYRYEYGHRREKKKRGKN